MNGLHVPDEAASAGAHALNDLPEGADDVAIIDAVLPAAAPAIVAAELRRLASEDRFWRTVGPLLLARADELDGGAR